MEKDRKRRVYGIGSTGTLHKKESLILYCLNKHYKFVTKGRKNRSGNENRKFEDKELEIDLLKNEISALNPKIVILQSRNDVICSGLKQIVEYLSEKGICFYRGYHPSYRPIQNPKRFIENMEKVDLQTSFSTSIETSPIEYLKLEQENLRGCT